MATWALPLTAAYVLGSIPTGLLLGLVKGIDIRTRGSGNIGAANVTRELGLRWGAASMFGDALKGALAVLVCRVVGSRAGFAPDSAVALNALGAALAIVGHNWSIFLLFRGGKGVATSLGTCLLIHWQIALFCFVLWAVVVVVTRYASVASILSTIVAAVLGPLFLQPLPYKLLFILVGVFALIRHHANIRRLIAGTEAKLGRRSDVEESESAEDSPPPAEPEPADEPESVEESDSARK